MTKTNTSKDKPKMRRRLGREEREALIVKEAIAFFAEHGFEGKTRDLAKRMGITQPLLYRYFPSKESLIERVYDEVYVSRWKAHWEDMIRDRSRPLTDRLIDFYQEYADAIYDYVWVRIFIFSGLKGVDINKRYMTLVRTRILLPICEELRHEYNLGSPEHTHISRDELELVWGLHGMFFYRAIRHFVYHEPMVDDPKAAIATDIQAFLGSAKTTISHIIDRQT